jgi:hypothetical protein
LSLPGGGQLGVYEPHHVRPIWSQTRTRKATKRRGPDIRRVAKKKTPKPVRRGRRRTRR